MAFLRRFLDRIEKQKAAVGGRQTALNSFLRGSQMLFPALQIDAPVAVAIAGAEAKDQNLGTGPKLVQKLIQRGRFGWGERPYIRRRWIP